MALPTAPALDPTPPRPDQPVPPPAAHLHLTVEIEVAHLANPLLAVQRLLASEAELLARVDGDDTHMDIRVALPDFEAETIARAESWCRWAIHIAGVRGTISLAS